MLEIIISLIKTWIHIILGLGFFSITYILFMATLTRYMDYMDQKEEAAERKRNERS